MGLIWNGTSSCDITTPGDYVIDRDMTSYSGHAIRITPGTHYVNLHLRSRIVGAGAPDVPNNGIEANGCAAINIIGEGGYFRGFQIGVNLQNTNVSRVMGVYLQDGLFQGINCTGPDTLVDGCDIRKIGGTQLFKDAQGNPYSRNFGIQLTGIRPKILRNYVEDIDATEESVSISVTDLGIGGIIASNIGKNMSIRPRLAIGTPQERPSSYGIWVGGASDVTCADNLLDRFAVGACYSSPPTGQRGGNEYFNCTQDFLDSGGDIVLGHGDI